MGISINGMRAGRRGEKRSDGKFRTDEEEGLGTEGSYARGLSLRACPSPPGPFCHAEEATACTEATGRAGPSWAGLRAAAWLPLPLPFPLHATGSRMHLSGTGRISQYDGLDRSARGLT